MRIFSNKIVPAILFLTLLPSLAHAFGYGEGSGRTLIGQVGIIPLLLTEIFCLRLWQIIRNRPISMPAKVALFLVIFIQYLFGSFITGSFMSILLVPSMGGMFLVFCVIFIFAQKHVADLVYTVWGFLNFSWLLFLSALIWMQTGAIHALHGFFFREIAIDFGVARSMNQNLFGFLLIPFQSDQRQAIWWSAFNLILFSIFFYLLLRAKDKKVLL